MYPRGKRRKKRNEWQWIKRKAKRTSIESIAIEKSKKQVDNKNII